MILLYQIEKTCSTLLPRHGGTPAKEAQEAPYTVEQSASTYQPGDQVKGKIILF